MQFVDEVIIKVTAGHGGHGCLSFRREKYVAKGGPDGGNGGKGGDIILRADPHLNTLVDFRYQRKLIAQRGTDGSGRSRSGKAGDDNIVNVPVGTQIYATATEELIADLTEAGKTALVAKGGEYGIGNEHYKTSTNRAPRKTTRGKPGEERELRLELKLLADVGLLGLPNAGKSTLVRACSNATPKVADYPFTTLQPHLGMVRISAGKSFVIADIPGLIPGAAKGAGLGIQFLKHLSRTAILLHVVDLTTEDPQQDPIATALNAINNIEKEMAEYDNSLMEKPRWLVFNKVDCLTDEEAKSRQQAIIKASKWDGPVYAVSAMAKKGTELLCYHLMQQLEKNSSATDTSVNNENN